MNDRERWIVYPLLFLALGASLRDKLFDQTRSRSVVCEQLVLVSDGKSAPQEQKFIGVFGPREAVAGAVPRGGQLTVDVIRAGTVIADNYSYQGITFSPTLRVAPKISLPDLLKALGSRAGQKEANSHEDSDAPAEAKDAADDKTATPADSENQGPSGDVETD
jgi:hypothetical protein